MIDEYYTWKIFGYHSYDLPRWSRKLIVVMCDECCEYRTIRNDYHADLCHRCCLSTPEMLAHIATMSKNKPPCTDEARINMSKAQQGQKHPPTSKHTKKLISKANTGHEVSGKTRRKVSATKQGIPYDEWTGFATENQYCEKFDDACRERVRKKYKYRCFVCDKHQDENITKNGKHKKLSVHHVDMNKDQGCNGAEWKLVPLCMSCHSKAHFEPMKSRIEYISGEI